MIFTGKRLSWSLFLIKLPTWGPATLLKRDSNTGVLLKTHFVEEDLPCFWLQQSYISIFREITNSKFQGQHADNLISVDMKVYALQVKQTGFHFFQGSYLLNHQTMFFLHKYSHSESFQFRLSCLFLYT